MEEQKLIKRKRKAAGNNTLLASICTDLAEHYTSTNQFEAAIEEFEIVANIYKAENKIVEYGSTHRGIGEAYMGLHQFQNAQKHFKIFYESALKANNNLEQQRALATLGHLFLTWYLETICDDVDNKTFLNEAYGYFIKSLKKCELMNETVQKQEMLARLFSNCAIVKENLEDYSKALGLYRKSIEICLKHDFYDQLYRGYISMAGLLDKEQQFQESIKNYNLAFETAKKLGTKKKELMCAALLAKSITLIKIVDFNGAKQVLVKAYKLQSPVEDERKNIEKNLRVVAAMVQFEDQLISCSDPKKLKQIYEKMGDAASEKLKNYEKAIEYYKKMLECAEKYGASDKELQECYVSLGATYEDNSQFREAEMFYEKEYNLCKNKLTDGNDTLCKMADLKERCGDDVAEVKNIYQKCLENCRQKGSKIEEKRILIRYIAYLRRVDCHTDAFKIQQYLDQFLQENNLENDSSSSENESQESAKIAIGEDINLSDLTDLSDDSDIENDKRSPGNRNVPKRTRQTAVKFKKNAKGEWPLHVAAIKGNTKMVKYWLDVAHPVNVRDNCGWLPLHEAAICGHLEIVALLLDRKAAINDKGGVGCGGRTPLHDACANGHLDVIELLLDRGASAVVKTDEGGTALYELKEWHKKNAPLEPHEEQQYRRIVERFEAALEKVGQKDNSFEKMKLPTPEKEHRISVTSQSPLKIGRLRKNPDLFEDFEISDESPQYEDQNIPSQALFSQKNIITNEYREVMQTLRHKNQSKTATCVKKDQKRTALVAVDDVSGDEWLEDDLGPIRNKKRRIDDAEKVWRIRDEVSPQKRSRNEVSSQKKIGVLRRNASFGSHASSPAKSGISDSISETDPTDPFPISSIFELEDSPLRIEERRISSDSNSSSNSNFSTSNSNKSRRTTQISLAQLGFSSSKQKSGLTRLSLKRNISFDSSYKTQQKKLTNFAHQTNPNFTLEHHNRSTPIQDLTNITSFTQNSSNFGQTNQDPTLYVDVDIEKKIFRVPVLYSQVQGRTIRWLADEAAQRYASKEFKKPTLELETSSGAILADEDLLSLLFPMGGLQAEKVVAKVKEWSLQPLAECYKESCQHMSVEINTTLCHLLEKTSVSVDLKDHGILPKNLCPVLKALNHQNFISELNLSGNFLSTASVNLLSTTLTTLPNLQSLDLSCTGLRSCHVSMLKSVFDGFNKFSKLLDLNFSHNSLKNDSIRDLAQILANLSLNSFGINNIDLSEGAFTSLPDVCWALGELKHLDIGNNALEVADVEKIVGGCDHKKLISLDISNNFACGVLHHILETFKDSPILTLENVNLTRCGVSETDLYELLRSCPKLTTLDLKYNPNLTSISLRRILERNQLKTVNLTGCQNIFNYFDINENIWDLRFGQGKNDCHIKLTGVKNHEECQTALVSLFTQKYFSCIIEKSDDFLCITC